MCGTTLELLGSHCCSVSPLSVAPRVALGGWMWPGKRESPTRCSLLPLNAGTAEPFRVSPPEAVAYQLELRDRIKISLPSSCPVAPVLRRSLTLLACVRLSS